MVEQLALLILVVAVAVGLVTVTCSALLVHSRRTAFFRYFLANILLFNLLVLGGLVFRYADVQLQEWGVSFRPALLLALLVVMAVLKIGWLYAFASVNLVLSGQEPLLRSGRRALAVAWPLLLAWAILLFFGAAAGFPSLVQFLVSTIEVAVICGAIGACVYLLSRARALPAGQRRISLGIFGGLNLSVFVAMLVSLFLAWLRDMETTPHHVLFNGILMVVYNLLPLAWILRFQPLCSLTDSINQDRYGITAREREIIELICAGKTNQEIGERLFISLATVKDHNFNIFRKTGVRNRVELANLFQAFRQGGDD